MAGERLWIASTSGFSNPSRKLRAYEESDSTYRRFASAKRVSNAKEDLPDPEALKADFIEKARAEAKAEAMAYVAEVHDLCALAGAAHMVQLEQPGELASRLGAWLSQGPA